MTSAAENVEKLMSAFREVLIWVDRDSDSSVTQKDWDWHLRHYSKRASKLLKEIEDEEERKLEV